MTLSLSMKKNDFNDNIFVATGKKEDFKCSQCLKEIDEGFICENKEDLVLCEECQDNFKMFKCKHNKIKEHKHIKWFKSNAQ